VQRVVGDVAATVGRMREFSRKRNTEMVLAPLDLNTLVPQVVELTEVRWSDMAQRRGHVVKVEMNLAPDLPVVMGVESEIREALTNLVLNAVDAMPEGGRLTLRTQLAQVRSATHVVVEVADTGVGMDEETRRRCFEPFFTTKGAAGTGLGMAMVYGIVKRHSAGLDIESAVGSGTTVRLSFLAQTPIKKESVPADEKRKTRTRPLRILIADDDPYVLDSMRMVLQLDGHSVVTADGGQSCIDIFRSARDKQPFEVVITDLGMPYVDGRQVTNSIKSLSPSTHVILLTGWGDRMIAEGQKPAGVDQLLGKPPQLQELRAALARVTDRTKSPAVV
jgi:CheY-like chemotaxis protein